MTLPYLPVLSSAQMKACDDYTINNLGVPSQTLMERAAARVSDVLLTDVRFDKNHVLVLAGGGNNGGDGIALSRILNSKSSREICVSVCFVGTTDEDGLPDLTKMSVECTRQYRLALNEGVNFISYQSVILNIEDYSCIVDAIFGIGLTRDVEGKIADIIRFANNSGLKILSIDTPSGIDADNGRVCGVAIKSDVTVCIQALKTGLLLFPASDFTGEIKICDIDIDCSPICEKEYARILSKEQLPKIFNRMRRSNKGSFGRVLFVCGSHGMSGAAYLSTSAALRCGIGLAHVLTHESNRIIIQSQLPEAILSAYNDENLNEAKFSLNNALHTANVALIGCGLGRSKVAFALLERALNFEENKILVLDADALNIIAQNPQLWHSKRFTDKENHVTVITPHPAEFARLCGVSVTEILRDVPFYAKKFAAERGVYVILKDAHTVIASPSGLAFINPHGNSGMAKGGSGDVLAGIVAAMLTNSESVAQDDDITSTLAGAVLLHSLAGKSARELKGEISMLPTDVIDCISHITRNFCDTVTKFEYI